MVGSHGLLSVRSRIAAAGSRPSDARHLHSRPRRHRHADPRPELVELQLAGKPRQALARVEQELAARPEASRRLGLDYLRGHLLDRLGRLPGGGRGLRPRHGARPRSLQLYSRYRLALDQDRHGAPRGGGRPGRHRGRRRSRARPCSPRRSASSPTTLAEGGDCQLLRGLRPEALPPPQRREIQLAQGECALRTGYPEIARSLLVSLLEESRDDEPARLAAERLAAPGLRRRARPAADAARPHLPAAQRLRPRPAPPAAGRRQGRRPLAARRLRDAARASASRCSSQQRYAEASLAFARLAGLARTARRPGPRPLPARGAPTSCAAPGRRPRRATARPTPAEPQGRRLGRAGAARRPAPGVARRLRGRRPLALRQAHRATRSGAPRRPAPPSSSPPPTSSAAGATAPAPGSTEAAARRPRRPARGRLLERPAGRAGAGSAAEAVAPLPGGRSAPIPTTRSPAPPWHGSPPSRWPAPRRPRGGAWPPRAASTTSTAPGCCWASTTRRAGRPSASWSRRSWPTARPPPTCKLAEVPVRRWPLWDEDLPSPEEMLARPGPLARGGAGRARPLPALRSRPRLHRRPAARPRAGSTRARSPWPRRCASARPAGVPLALQPQDYRRLLYPFPYRETLLAQGVIRGVEPAPARRPRPRGEPLRHLGPLPGPAAASSSSPPTRPGRLAASSTWRASRGGPLPPRGLDRPRRRPARRPAQGFSATRRSRPSPPTTPASPRP